MSISVIIPTLQEQSTVAETIRRTRQIGECEIIVADGGSKDSTFDCASTADTRLISQPGRAYQLNAGAAKARHDNLLFLHSDSRLDPSSFQDIAEYMRDQSSVGGCFRLQIDNSAWKYRIAERCIAARVRLLKWAYGDQGIFVRREVFERLGGFPRIGLMEDLFFVKKLKKAGRFSMLSTPIQTSARRWDRYGLLRQTMRNWTLITLAHCGVSPDRLAKFYARHR